MDRRTVSLWVPLSINAAYRCVSIGIVSETHYAMLLCRVCLGEMYRIEDFDLKGERHVVGVDAYDSLLGDREAKRGTFREFIVYDEAQVYRICRKLDFTGPGTPEKSVWKKRENVQNHHFARFDVSTFFPNTDSGRSC